MSSYHCSTTQFFNVHKIVALPGDKRQQQGERGHLDRWIAVKFSVS